LHVDQVNEVALGVFSYFLPISITLSGVYLAYTGFQSVSGFYTYVSIDRCCALLCSGLYFHYVWADVATRVDLLEYLPHL